MTRALLPWAAVLGMGLGVAPAARAQEPAPPPSTAPPADVSPGPAPTASPSPAGDVGLPCAPSPVPPEFPSGGGLVRGDVRYEAVSTNAIKPSVAGLKPTVITGTFFRKEGQTVAAVERLVPARVLMQCSVPPREQAIFAAIGAALFVRDGEAWRYEH